MSVVSAYPQCRGITGMYGHPQHFFQGWANYGSGGLVPSRGPEMEPRWGSGEKPPEADTTGCENA